MRQFKKGDDVECLLWGMGKVVSIRPPNVLMPVYVRFAALPKIGELMPYTCDGKLIGAARRTLFHKGTVTVTIWDDTDDRL